MSLFFFAGESKPEEIGNCEADGPDGPIKNSLRDTFSLPFCRLKVKLAIFLDCVKKKTTPELASKLQSPAS